MKKENLALALTCMAMLAMDYNSENNNKSRIIRRSDKRDKDITKDFPSMEQSASDDYEHNLLLHLYFYSLLLFFVFLKENSGRKTLFLHQYKSRAIYSIQ